MTVVLTEQMAMLALKASDDAFVLRRGALVLQGSSPDFIARGVAGELSAAYL